MAWDPSGERLAVLFQKTKDESHSDEVIALFNTRLQPVLELIPWYEMTPLSSVQIEILSPFRFALLALF